MYGYDSFGCIEYGEGYRSIECIVKDLIFKSLGSYDRFIKLGGLEKLNSLSSLVMYLEGSMGNLKGTDLEYIENILDIISEGVTYNLENIRNLYSDSLDSNGKRGVNKVQEIKEKGSNKVRESIYMVKYKVDHENYVVLFVEAVSEKQAKYLTSVELVNSVLGVGELSNFNYVYNTCKCFVDKVRGPLRGEGRSQVLNIEGSNILGSNSMYMLKGDTMIDKSFADLNGSYFAIY